MEFLGNVQALPEGASLPLRIRPAGEESTVKSDRVGVRKAHHRVLILWPELDLRKVNKEQGRSLFGVNGEVRPKKDLTGPTLLKMSG
jgi:hypothetical protein